MDPSAIEGIAIRLEDLRATLPDPELVVLFGSTVKGRRRADDCRAVSRYSWANGPGIIVTFSAARTERPYRSNAMATAFHAAFTGSPLQNLAKVVTFGAQ
jgi:hypothetical protein